MGCSHVRCSSACKTERHAQEPLIHPSVHWRCLARSGRGPAALPGATTRPPTTAAAAPDAPAPVPGPLWPPPPATPACRGLWPAHPPRDPAVHGGGPPHPRAPHAPLGPPLRGRGAAGREGGRGGGEGPVLQVPRAVRVAGQAAGGPVIQIWTAFEGKFSKAPPSVGDSPTWHKRSVKPTVAAVVLVGDTRRALVASGTWKGSCRGPPLGWDGMCDAGCTACALRSCRLIVGGGPPARCVVCDWPPVGDGCGGSLIVLGTTDKTHTAILYSASTPHNVHVYVYSNTTLSLREAAASQSGPGPRGPRRGTGSFGAGRASCPGRYGLRCLVDIRGSLR